MEKHAQRNQKWNKIMDTCAIIILYNPLLEETNKLLDALTQQVDHIYLVDNSQNKCNNLFKRDNVSYFFLNGNKGIAAAQNYAIQQCIKDKYSYILFCDQDSLLPNKAVEALYLSYKMLKKQNIKVGSVGSIAINKKTSVPYSLGCSLIKENAFPNLTEVSYTMNSISFFPTEYFQIVGLMDEKLFIDGVDSEICWRGKQYGYHFYINNNVRIEHLLGLGSKKILNKYISITPPKRMYFQYRNYLLLARRNYTPKSWLKYNGIKYAIKLLYYPIMITPRLGYIKYITKGIIEGIRNKHS